VCKTCRTNQGGRVEGELSVASAPHLQLHKALKTVPRDCRCIRQAEECVPGRLRSVSHDCDCIRHNKYAPQLQPYKAHM